MRGLTTLQDVEATFDRRLDQTASAPIALALSGGGDSMALLLMAGAWARRCGRRLIALTVDHGLHPGSARWTAFAGAAAKAAGAEWRGLAWTGEKPNTGLPAAARAARHRLLAEAARQAGAGVVLFAHTADDMIESDLMRAATPTLGYFNEWSPSPVWPEGRRLFAFRPLLRVRRSELRTWLRTHGRDWLEDPGNDDHRFARARARSALAATTMPADSPTPVGDQPIELAEAAEIGADGSLAISRLILAGVGAASARKFLSVAAVCASGRPSPPRGETLDRLLLRLKRETSFVMTLAGARIEVDAARVTFAREAGDIRRSGLPPMHLAKGQTAVWDGRFEIEAKADITVAPLAGCAARLSEPDRARLSAVPAVARPSLPALFHDGSVSLPAPFGAGPACATVLAGDRLAAACGLIANERDISRNGMAQRGWSSYVEALALA